MEIQFTNTSALSFIRQFWFPSIHLLGICRLLQPKPVCIEDIGGAVAQWTGHSRLHS